MRVKGKIIKKEEIMRAFQKKQAEILLKFLNMIEDLVKVSDFNELKEIVRELAEAQKRTEERINELAEAQKKTEIEIRTLVRSINSIKIELGGLSKSMSYAFENEVFRVLPSVLKEKYGIEIERKFIREEIGGKEINLFGRGKKNGKDIYIVGEAKLRIEKSEEDIKTLLEEFEEKIEAVRGEVGEVEIMKIFVTHYAGRGFLKEAEKRGIIVIQSFEW